MNGWCHVGPGDVLFDRWRAGPQATRPVGSDRYALLRRSSGGDWELSLHPAGVEDEPGMGLVAFGRFPSWRAAAAFVEAEWAPR